MAQNETNISETKITLKLLIDSKAKKVLFAEAGKDFVDFLLHIFSLPIGTVLKLLTAEGMVGCLGDLYKSIEALNGDYFQPNLNKGLVLEPKAPVNVPLLSLNDAPDNNNTSSGYVKGLVTYMVMDNLEVKPMSTISGITILNKFNVKDIASLVEKEVQVGLNEALAMLKASLETRAVITAVFLGNNSKEQS